MDPSTYSEMRPGAYDIHERVRDMNHNGILSSMCFPSFAGFNARFFYEAKDHDLALIMLKAYNDWHIDEWCTAYPGRFIPLGIAPVWDPNELADEIRRLSSKGCKAVTMPELPHLMGLPSYHDMDYWGPFFQTACDEQVVMCLHIGQGFSAIQSAPAAPIDNLIILATQVSAIAAQDLLWGPAFHQYPDLKVAWSEAGIGWIPFYLNRCDRHYTNQRWLDHDFGDKLPSDIFRDQLCMNLGIPDLLDFQINPASDQVLQFVLQGFDILAFLADNQARSRDMENHLDLDTGSFDLDAVNSSGTTLGIILDEVPYLLILQQQARKFLLGGKPAAFPAEGNTGAETNWINFLAHRSIL